MLTPDPKIPTDELPTQDKREKFFIKIEDYILISEQISSLIEIEYNIKKNKSWTKKLNISKFKNQMNESHNISVLLDYSRFTNNYNSKINLVSYQMSLKVI